MNLTATPNFFGASLLSPANAANTLSGAVRNFSYMPSTSEPVVLRSRPDLFVPLAEKRMITVGRVGEDCYFTINDGVLKNGLGSKIDALVAEGQMYGRRMAEDLQRFYSLIGASRLNLVENRKALSQIKGEIMMARPKAGAAVESYRKDLEPWETRFSLMTATVKNTGLYILLLSIMHAMDLKAAADISVIEDLLRVENLILDYPEIRCIEPNARGLRIIVDVPEVVKNHGTMKGYAGNLSDKFNRFGINSPIIIEREDRIEELQKRIVQEIITPNVPDLYGKKNCVKCNCGTTQRGDELELRFYVKAGYVKEVRRLLPEIRKFLKPYALEGFSDKIRIVALKN